MLQFRIIVTAVLCLLQFQLSVTSNRAFELKTEDIKFWDIDNSNDISSEDKTIIKNNIVSQLNDVTFDEDQTILDGCVCPKIIGPIICDNLGKAHLNICLYLCTKRSAKDLMPRKVLMNLGTADFNESCKL